MFDVSHQGSPGGPERQGAIEEAAAPQQRAAAPDRGSLRCRASWKRCRPERPFNRLLQGTWGWLGERVSVRHIGLGDDQGFSYGTAKLLKSSREIWVHWGLRGSIPDGVHSKMTPRDMSRREDNLPLPSTRWGVFLATPLHAGGRNGAHGSYSSPRGTRTFVRTLADSLVKKLPAMKTKHSHSTHTEGPNPKAIHFEAGFRILATNQPRG